MNFKSFKEKLKDLEYNNLYPLFFTLIFILILIQYSFNSFDAIFYDLWVRSDFMAETKGQVVLVVMDEESDQFLGDVYPYTYATHLRLLKRLRADSPKVISYLIPFLQPQDDLEKSYFSAFYKEALSFSEEAGGVFRFGTDKDSWGEQIPYGELENLGYSLALINQDGNTFAKDAVSRRLILNASGEDTLHLWIANEFKKTLGLNRTEASEFKGAYYSRESDATFSLYRYSFNPNSFKSIRSIPFHRVVVGNYPKHFFKDKIVMIGSSYVSNPSDFVYTPFGKTDFKAPKLAIHANIVEALIKDWTVYQVPSNVTDIISIIISILLSFIISKVRPTRGLIMTVGIIFFVFSLSFFLFVFFGVWLKLAHIVLSIFVVYYIWVPFRAIGEYQTRYAIQEESKMLKKVDRLKQNFISLMSHDLKTPVAKIAGIADILRAQYQNVPRQQQLLDNIVDSTKELNDFITSILDLTKIESRNITLKPESKDVNNVIEQVTKKLIFEANAKSMTINKDLSPLYPIKIDSILIERALANIIGNAIKYAGAESEVNIKSWDDEDWVYIEIADTGKGITKQDLDHIFDKFYRVKNDDSHQIKGSGLGLYLVKYFIELHKGKISVESEIGQGTKFLIRLKNE